jgi:ElaB/YqjD/DUF883 family membrane-anchored ribosome-binding protein
MVVRKAAQSDKREANREAREAVETASDLIEESVVAFAEQLGSLVGTVQGRAEGWLDRKELSKEVGRIRDSASSLLDEMNRRFTVQRRAAAKQTTPPTRPSRGPVDAPGKRHRKPTPQEPIDKHMGEPRGKQMGQKNVKTGRRGGRG